MRFIAISSLSLPEIRRRSVGLLPGKRRAGKGATRRAHQSVSIFSAADESFL
jgi:hypothetical protein